jgi:hypothetical protein
VSIFIVIAVKMHPLDTSLDRSWHEGRHGHKVKRRSSLDNSCLASNNSFRQIITLDFTASPARQHRRLSLNPSNTVTTNFMATGTDHRPQMELDLDWHTEEPVLSNGNPRRFERGTSKLIAESENSNETLITVDTEKDHEDEISLDSSNSSDSSSDCDSFCDASFHEPADKDYLRNNLGASCFWNSQASLVDDHEIKFNKDAVGAVMEEDEDEYEDDYEL